MLTHRPGRPSRWRRRRLRQLEQQPLGFHTEGRIVARIRPPALAGEVDRLASLYARLSERLHEIPGVLGASYSLYSPMQGDNWSSGISVAGRPADPERGDVSSWNRIGPGYFETLGTRVLRGRAIDARDTPDAPRAAVVNEAFVRRFLPGADPLGRRLGIGGASHAGDFEIVGVTEDVKYTGAAQPTRPMIFMPALQVPAYEDAGARNVQARSTLMGAIALHVRPGLATPEAAIRRAIAEVDPDFVVMRVLPLADQVGLNFRVNRLMARVTLAYGLLALGLASLGLYGVTAYGVARRTREIGVRLALGAEPSRVVREVVRGALLPAAIGVLVGVPAALASAGVLASLLYGVGARDPLVLTGSVIAVLASALLAAVVPARRAASVDPMRALRVE